MQHSVLGTRWVYDGLRDPQFVVMLAAVAMTGQGEALGMVVYDGRWYIAPSNVRIQGGGWTQERVPVDGFEARTRRRDERRAPQRPVRADRVPPPRARTSSGHRAHRDLGRAAEPGRARRGEGTLELTILIIWGDDIGISNLSCYSDGLMGYRTPNIDRLADEGVRFTDYYGEQSCTAGPCRVHHRARTRTAPG